VFTQRLRRLNPNYLYWLIEETQVDRWSALYTVMPIAISHRTNIYLLVGKLTVGDTRIGRSFDRIFLISVDRCRFGLSDAVPYR